MNRRYLSFIIYYLSFSAALLFSACSSDSSADNAAQQRARQRDDSLALKVAVTPTLDCLPLFVAVEKGMFTKEGISVKLRMFQAQMDEDTAIVNKRVEGMMTDSVRVSYLREHEKVALRQMATTSLKWQLITNKTARIKQLPQLHDKMIAMTRNSATEMLAKKAVSMSGLLSEHVFFIQINDIAVRLGMLENDVMDAMFLPEPQATSARLQGHEVLMDTETMGMRLGALVFREEALADTARLHQAETFVKVYRQACDSVSKNGLTRYRDIIEFYCHVSKAIVDSIR